MKTCRHCLEERPLSYFSKDSAKKDGMRSVCKPCDTQKASVWYAKNNERAAASRKLWAANNKDKVKEYDKKCYNLNAEHYKEQDRIRYENNKAQILAAMSLRYFNDPDKSIKVRAKNARRRALVQSAGGTHNHADIANIIKLQKKNCACCKRKLAASAYHIDHITPLARGGTNGAENLQALCANCNLSKGAKDPIDFMQAKGFLL